jgi:hypothetical protein
MMTNGICEALSSDEFDCALIILKYGTGSGKQLTNGRHEGETSTIERG